MNKRVDGLNFIRIIGMTIILLFHARLMYGFSTDNAWLDDMISIGAIFITVFFMLSGFGLRKSNRNLSIKDKGGLKQYYKKRILAIYPLFLLLQIVALIFQFRVADSLEETLALLPIQFTMLHILSGKEMHGFLFNDNCWYISALFVLYLLFPFFNELVKQLDRKMKWMLCVFLWFLSVGIYFYLVFCTKYVFLDYYPNPFLRIPEFVIGMLLADLSKNVNDETWMGKFPWLCKQNRNLVCGAVLSTVVIMASVCLTFLYPYFKQETNLYNVLVIPCTGTCFLCIANWDWLNWIGGKKAVRWLSGLGLEMYLCQSFATLTLTHMKVDGAWDEMAFIGLSVGFAVVVSVGVARPIKKRARG